MKSREQQVVHLGRTVAEWREIAGCIRNSAKIAPTRLHQDALNRMASDIEHQLPAKEQSNG